MIYLCDSKKSIILFSFAFILDCSLNVLQQHQSDSDDSLLTSSSCSSVTDDEIDLTEWTQSPTINRDPFPFVSSREIPVEGAQTPIAFWTYIFPRNLAGLIVYETNRYAENKCNHSNPRRRYTRINKWEPTNIEEIHVFIALLILQGIIKQPDLQMYTVAKNVLPGGYSPNDQ